MLRASFYWLLPTLCLFAPLEAQDRVAIDARFVPATAKPGQQVTLEIAIEVEAGWHVYGKLDPDPLTLSVLDTQTLRPVGEVLFPDGQKHEAFGVTNYWVTGSPVLRQRYEVPKDAKLGELNLAGTIDCLVCNENACDPPKQIPFTARLLVSAAGSLPVSNDKAPGAKPAEGSAVGLSAGLSLGRQNQTGDSKLTIKARVEPAQARPGETVRLTIAVEVAEHWHVYGSQETTGLPVRLEIRDAAKLSGLNFDALPVVPPGELHADSVVQQYWLSGAFAITQDISVAMDAALGGRSITGVFNYSVCNENSCLSPSAVPFTVPLTIEAGAARVEYGANAASSVAATKPLVPQNRPDLSLWLLILSCIGGGLFALAMPCTYPMIPITFSFFTKQAEKRGGKVLPLALTYGVGIVLMFVIVGVSLSVVIVDIVNHWLTNVVIFASFVGFAAVLFGFINLQPPAAVQRVAGEASRSGGYLGVFFMGATLVITSFTCTAPIVGTLLANVAEYGPGRVAFGMAIFGMTMALPFVLLALMPTKVKRMPRSGEWMDTLKVSLGFVELAASIKFLSQVDIAFGWQLLPRELFLLLWTALFVLWAMFLFGILRKAGSANEGVGAGRMASGMLVSLLATYFLFGALGYRLDFVMTNFVPAYSATPVVERAMGRGGNAGQQTAHLLVKDDADAAVALAKREGKLLLYNFTGFN
ncbi:MAG: protein-disulfide reductase DsbD family protein [Planctomycetota bacterium]|nr:protein-disulfide reductase DsbD family protein [Planctomycetota bacterium]